MDLGPTGAGRRAVRRPAAGAVALLVAAGCTAAEPAAPSPRPVPASGGERRRHPADASRRRAPLPPGPAPGRADRATAAGGERPAPVSVTAGGEDAIVTADRRVFVLDRWSRGPGRSAPATPWPRSTGAGSGCSSGGGGARSARSAWTAAPAGHPGGCLHHRPARPGHRPDPGPLPRGLRSRRQPGPLGRPRGRRRVVHPDRPPHRHQPSGAPPHPLRPGQPGAGQPRQPAAGRRVRRPVLEPGPGPDLRHLAAGPPDPPLAPAARHAPDHRGEVREPGLDRRRSAAPGR
jgi:hypothetical protein